MKKTFKNITYLFFATVFAKFIGVFTTFFIAKILQPSNYGIWITMILISAYAPILCFGVAETLLKQFPYHIGKGNPDKAREIDKAVFASIILEIRHTWIFKEYIFI